MPYPKKRVINSCLICSKNFDVQLSSEFKKVTCSKECSSKHRSNKRIGKKHNIKPVYNKCIRCNVEFLINGEFKKKRNKKYCTSKCQNDDHSERLKGENSPNWKGGVANTNKRGEFKREIYNWRVSVFKRDLYKCQHCGSNKKLEAHHIVPWAKSVELRFILSNGLTLCIDCHGKVHGVNFGVRRKKNCVDCKKEINLQSKRCVECYVLARKNKIIVNRVPKLI